MTPAVIGIDPGVGGAIAILSGNHVEIYDMPTKPTKRGKAAEDVDARKLAYVLRPGMSATIFIEAINASSRQAGQSAFCTNYGRVLGVCELYYSTTPVPPSKWKPALGLTGKQKSASVALAQQLFPQHAHLLVGPRGGLMDGRAEALLIAWHGRRELLKEAALK